MSVVKGVSLLKKALEMQDWGLVGQAYEILSGDPPPKTTPGKRGKKASVTVPPPRDSNLVPAKVNLFRDDFSLATELIPDSKKHSKTASPKQRRPAYRPVPVTCSVCGKREEVHPDLVPPQIDEAGDPESETPGYRCNRCLGGR